MGTVEEEKKRLDLIFDIDLACFVTFTKN